MIDPPPEPRRADQAEGTDPAVAEEAAPDKAELMGEIAKEAAQKKAEQSSSAT
ncbi:MAG: hypothetical protein U0790_24135 [Isosphaeraceae bacterium]